MRNLSRPVTRYSPVILTVLLLGAGPLFAKVTLDGMPLEWARIASWLTASLGAEVTVDVNGDLAVGPGGGVAAERLRIMTTSATAVKMKIVKDDATVVFDQWLPNKKSKTSGEQSLDVGDLERIGNVFNSNGLTADVVIMHAITEVYEGTLHRDDCMTYLTAHMGPALAAEKEVMAGNGTSIESRDGWAFSQENDGDYFYRKMKRPDGSFIVVRFKDKDGNPDVQWFTEKVPCKFHPTALIAIPDPDPKVHVFTYDRVNLNHTITSTFDASNSRPTGIAFDPQGNSYVTEDLTAAPDEVRVFDAARTLVRTITHPFLTAPEGIDFDPQTGHLFVAVAGRVLRLTSTGSFVGSYTVPDPSFTPTDVAVWRDSGWPDGQAGDSSFALFVSDRASSNIYRFDATADLNAGTASATFGSPYVSAPEGLSVSSADGVWVASTGNHRIVSFTTSGDLVRHSGNDYIVQDSLRSFYDVEALALDGLYVVDHTPGAGALLLYDFAGNVVRTYGQPALVCPASLKIFIQNDPGNLNFMSDPGNPAVPAIGTTGLVLTIGILGLAGSLILLRRRLGHA